MAAENPNGAEKYIVDAEPVKVLKTSALDGGEKFIVDGEPIDFIFPSDAPVTTFTKGNFFLIGF